MGNNASSPRTAPSSRPSTPVISTKGSVEDVRSISGSTGPSNGRAKHKRSRSRLLPLLRRRKSPFNSEAVPTSTIESIYYWMRVPGKYAQEPHRVAPPDSHDSWSSPRTFYELILGDKTSMDLSDNPPYRLLILGFAEPSIALRFASEYPDAEVHAMLECGKPMDDPPPNCIFYEHRHPEEKLPFPSHHFDYIQQYTIDMEFAALSWRRVLNQLARVLDPCGLLEVIERLPYLDTDSLAGNQLNFWLRSAAQNIGHADPDLVEKLQCYATAAKLQVSHDLSMTLRVPFGNSGGWIGQLVHQQYLTRIWGVKPLVMNEGLTTSEEFDALINNWNVEVHQASFEQKYLVLILHHPWLAEHQKNGSTKS